MKAQLTDRGLSGQVGVALLVQAVAALGGLVGMLLRMGTSGVLQDVGIYYAYACRIWDGALPYRDFRVEYPPLAIPLFLLPSLVTHDQIAYAVVFGYLMFLTNCVLVILIVKFIQAKQKRDTVWSRVVWYTVCFSVLGPLAVSRFDLVPALLCVAALMVWSGGRSVAGGVMAAGGALIKVFPVLVVGLSLSGFRRRQWGALQGVGASLAILAAGCLLWLAVGGAEGVKSSIRFQSSRGLELESVYSGLLLQASVAGWIKPTLTYDETSWHVRVAGSRWVENTSFVLQLAAVLAAYWFFHRRGGADPVRCVAAAVVGCVAASKVLSPQFMLWILPLIVLLDGRLGRWARAVFLPCCVATSLVSPGLFLGLLHKEVLPIVVLNLRNLLLVALLFLLLFYRETRDETLPANAPVMPTA